MKPLSMRISANHRSGSFTGQPCPPPLKTKHQTLAKSYTAGLKRNLKAGGKKMANEMMKNVTGALAFFKVYMDDVDTQKLRIPVAFLERLHGDLRVVSQLETPAGRSWKVVVEKIESDVYFTGGWADFVNDNNLKFGDLLTFSYDGNSRFKVEIYGPNGCIKWDFTQEIPERNLITSFTEIPERNLITSFTEIPERNLITSFTVDISATSSLKGLLNIPAVFGNRFMKTGQHFEKWATLRTCKGSWRVRVCSECDRLRFRKGWIEFYRGNALSVGDTCRFKLIDEDNFILGVDIKKKFVEEKVEVIVL